MLHTSMHVTTVAATAATGAGHSANEVLVSVPVQYSGASVCLSIKPLCRSRQRKTRSLQDETARSLAMSLPGTIA